MSIKIKPCIELERIGIGPGESVKIVWSRDTGELAYGPAFPDRMKWRDDFVILARTSDPRDGLHVYIRSGSRIKVHRFSKTKEKMIR